MTAPTPDPRIARAIQQLRDAIALLEAGDGAGDFLGEARALIADAAVAVDEVIGGTP